MADTASQFTFPLIHFNGNSRESLLRDYNNARDKLQEAMEAYRRIDFHPRNYYPLAEGSYERALVEHHAHWRKYTEMDEYLTAHVVHLQGT